MKRVLPDQGLAPRTALLLRSEGWEAIHVSEAGLSRAEDIEILDFASKNGMACITFDHDFHAHLAFGRAEGPSVVLIRADGLSAEEQAALIRDVWGACEAAIDEGAAVSVDRAAIRLRRLPLR